MLRVDRVVSVRSAIRALPRPEPFPLAVTVAVAFFWEALPSSVPAQRASLERSATSPILVPVCLVQRMPRVPRPSMVVPFVFARLDRRAVFAIKQYRAHSVPHHPAATMAHVSAIRVSVRIIPVARLVIPHAHRVQQPRDRCSPVQALVRAYQVSDAFATLDLAATAVTHCSLIPVRILPASMEAHVKRCSMVPSSAHVPVDSREFDVNYLSLYAYLIHVKTMVLVFPVALQVTYAFAHQTSVDLNAISLPMLVSIHHVSSFKGFDE